MAVRIQRRHTRGCPAGFPYSGGGDGDGEGKARLGYTVTASHEEGKKNKGEGREEIGKLKK